MAEDRVKGLSPAGEDREDKPEITRREVSHTGGEEKENFCIALALTDSASSEEEEHLKPMDPSSELVASLKYAANAAASKVARSGDGGSAHQAQEEGCVAVVFPGSVTQDTCCKFVCEILKCVLYMRQQLPMTYDQLVSFQKKQQQVASRSDGVVGRRPAKASGWDTRKCQRTLQDLEAVLQHLEVLFSLSRVPRVLLLVGGTTVLPKELYEVNMEALAAGTADRSLRASACLRRLFHDLFLADLLSDARPVHLTATSVLALAHRDCGVGWFRPRLDYRVPTQPKRHVITLSCEPSIPGPPQANSGDDYVWFQAPVAIKGFCK